MNLPIRYQALLTGAVSLLVCIAASPAQAATLNPTADAYVRSGTHQNTNYGTATTLEIKKSASPTDDFNREIYLKFDLGSVTSIRSAKLRLYGSATSPEVVSTDLYCATQTTWTETGITWANKPATKAVMWSTVALQNSAAWHEWDITQFLQAEKTLGRNIVTLVLKNSVASTTGTIAFNSRQHSSNQPELVIDQAYPWTYYEAEAGTKHASATLDTGIAWGDVSYEARGKKTVKLTASPQFVQWTNVKAATHATVRYSIDDGATGTVGLYVNGAWKINLSLNSLRMRETKTGTAAPPSQTVRYFDDVMVAVPGGIPANATIKLQKDVTGTTPYWIDFIEVESAPDAGTKPGSNWVEVAQGTGSDRMAFVNAIATANAGSKKVWIPQGSFVINAPLPGEPNTTGWGIQVPAGIEIRGAGMWHTTITKNYEGADKRVFSLVGNGNIIGNFRCIDTITTLTGNGQNVVIRAENGTSGHLIENIWAEYASLVLGVSVSNTTVRSNRIRNPYKDSIHFARNASNNLFEFNAIRNSGDDNIALVAYQETGMTDNNVRYNVAECTYWGRGFTNIGGSGNTIRHNLVNDCSRAGVLVMTETYSGQTTQFCIDWVVERNTIVRCGNNLAQTNPNHSTGGALCIDAKIDASPVQGRMEYNYVSAPPYNGAVLTAFVGDTGTSNLVLFRYNILEGPAVGDSTWLRKKTSNLSSNHNCVHTPNTDI